MEYDIPGEARCIYRAMFSKEIPPVLVEHFVAASKLLHTYQKPGEVEEYYRLIQNVQDLEALEYAARFLHRIPLLTSKFRTMVYLAETLPENQHVFVNRRAAPVHALIASVGAVFWSVWKFIKGVILLRNTHLG